MDSTRMAMMRAATIFNVAGTLLLATGAAHAVEIPNQYRGDWCQTKWSTIYKRCRSTDAVEFTVLQAAWGADDEGCALTGIRKSKYGGHRLFGKCERVDPEPGNKGLWTTEERWWLGSNNTR